MCADRDWSLLAVNGCLLQDIYPGSILGKSRVSQRCVLITSKAVSNAQQFADAVEQLIDGERLLDEGIGTGGHELLDFTLISHT